MQIFKNTISTLEVLTNSESRQKVAIEKKL